MANSQDVIPELLVHIGKNSAELNQAIYQEFDAWNDATLIPNVKNEIRLTSLKIKKLSKPFNTTFNATEGAIQFTPRLMKIHRGKAELEVEPEQYRDTYLAQFMKPGVNHTPEDLPFAGYIMQQIIEEIREELNDDVAFDGVYDPNGTDAVDITNGWNTSLKEMITNGEVTPHVLGSIDSTNAYTKIKKLYRSIPGKYKKSKSGILTAYISQDMYDAIQDELETLSVNTGRGDDMLEPVYLRGSGKKLQIKPASWMGDSSRIIITPSWNLCILSDNTDNDINRISAIQKHYTAELSISFAIGFDFATNMIWCNEAE